MRKKQEMRKKVGNEKEQAIGKSQKSEQVRNHKKVGNQKKQEIGKSRDSECRKLGKKSRKLVNVGNRKKQEIGKSMKLEKVGHQKSRTLDKVGNKKLKLEKEIKKMIKINQVMVWTFGLVPIH